jgi:hypothetical protein
MPLLNSGRDLIANLLVGGVDLPCNHANAVLGVGDSSAVYNKTQTNLQAITNKTYKAMDPTFPTLAENIMTFQATFGPTDANYDWNEWGVFNALSAGIMLNRKVAFLGTKTSEQTWVLQAILTVNNPDPCPGS